MPHVAYLSAQFPKASETFVYREVLGLRERGWDVTPFTLRPSTEVPAGLGELAAQTRAVYGSKFLMPRPTRELAFPGEPTSVKDRLKTVVQAAAGAKLARLLRAEGITHVHAHFAHAPAAVAMYAARALGGTFSFTGHANDLFQRRALLKRKLTAAAFVGCISHWHRAFYRDIHPAGRYEIIRCGVDIEAFKPAEDKIFGRRVLTLCRLVAKKGVDVLIRGLPPGWRLTVAGDGPEREKLEELAGASGKAVTFLGSVDNQAVPDLLAGHDAFALPCRPDAAGDQDGIPVVLMEAMAAGVPVVSGDLPAIRELVRDDESGLLVEAGNEMAVAGALGVLENEETRHRLAAAGRQRVLEEFALPANLDRLEAALRQVLGTSDSGMCRSTGT